MFCRNCGKDLIGNPEYCMNCGARPLAGAAHCPGCGGSTTPLSVICVKCGARLEAPSQNVHLASSVSPKSRLALVLLAFFLGELGIHRFYAGQVGSGVLMLILTILGYSTVVFAFGFIPLAIMWVWNLIDFIIALVGGFKDKEGLKIANW